MSLIFDSNNEYSLKSTWSKQSFKNQSLNDAEKNPKTYFCKGKNYFYLSEDSDNDNEDVIKLSERIITRTTTPLPEIKLNDEQLIQSSGNNFSTSSSQSPSYYSNSSSSSFSCSKHHHRSKSLKKFFKRRNSHDAFIATYNINNRLRSSLSTTTVMIEKKIKNDILNKQILNSDISTPVKYLRLNSTQTEQLDEKISEGNLFNNNNNKNFLILKFKYF